MPCFNFYAPAWFHVIEASRKKCSVLAEFWKKKVARKLILFEWWPTYFFSHNLFIKSVLAISTLYSPIFCFLKVVYCIMFGVTPDIKIISFGVRRLKNRRVTPNGKEIKDEEWNFMAFFQTKHDSLIVQDWQGTYQRNSGRRERPYNEKELFKLYSTHYVGTYS